MIKPCGHTVLVKVDEVEQETDWGFKLTVTTDKRKLEQASQMIGELVAIGPQAWLAFSKNFDGEPWASVGDKVLFARYSGKCVVDPYTEEEFYIMNDEDIRAIIVAEEDEND